MIRAILELSILQLLALCLISLFPHYILQVPILVITAMLTLLILKSIEKKYYQRYATFSSLLYMSCPFIGSLVIGGLFLFFWPGESISYLFKFTISLYFLVMLWDLIYIIIKHR